MRYWLLLSLLLLPGCSVSESPQSPAPEHSQTSTFGADQRIIERKVLVGRPASTLSQYLADVPNLRVYGNGRVIYLQTQPDGSQQWRETMLASAELQNLIQTVVGADDQLCSNADIPHSRIMDAPVTIISVQRGDQWCEASADALSIAGTERTALTSAGQTLLDQLTQANQALEQLASRPGDPFKPDSIIIYVKGVQQAPPGTLPEWTFQAPPSNDTLVSGAETADILAFAAQPIIVRWQAEALEVLAVPELAQ